MPAKFEELIHDDIPLFWDKIKETFEDLLDKAVEWLGIDRVYILVGAGVLLLCIIIAILVHNANKRDRDYINKSEQRSPIEEAIATCDYEAIVNGNKKAASYIATDETGVFDMQPDQSFGVHKAYSESSTEDIETSRTMVSEVSAAETDNISEAFEAQPERSAEAFEAESKGSGDAFEAQPETISEDIKAMSENVSEQLRPEPVNSAESIEKAAPVTINMEKIEILRQETVRKGTAGTGIKYNVSRAGRTFTEEELNELIKD